MGIIHRLMESKKLFFDINITLAEDEQTVMAKEVQPTTNAQRVAIDSAHAQRDKPSVGLMQQEQNMIHSVGSAFNRTLKCIKPSTSNSISPKTSTLLKIQT
jgi:hypothetical protein